MGGCVSSRHNNNKPFRRKSTVLKDSRSSRFDSSRRIDDWIQPEVVFDRRSSSGRDAKDNNKFIESEMLSSNSYYYDHQEVEKILENPESAVHDQELRRASSGAVKPDLDVKPKLDRWNSSRDSKVKLSDHHQTDKEPQVQADHLEQAVLDQELRRASSGAVKPVLDMKPKLDRWNSSRDSKVRLIESQRLSDYHQSDKEAVVHPLELSIADVPKDTVAVPRELNKNQSVAAVPKDTELKQVSAEWPKWLVSVAGEALVDWAPRRASTFEKLEKIGEGTYSSVYRARDLIHNKIVALKKVRFDLNDIESVKFMAREIIVMRRLDHPNVLKLQGLITAPVSSSLYLVFDYMDHDLLGLSSLPGVNFTEPQVKCYMRQLLSGLEHCHSHGVLHRDIKGSNLLIDSNGVLKIADFGLATFFDPDKTTVPLTSHVVTLWYRPPELLLGASRYGVGVDLWSTGCILGELYAGKPILPGKTEVEQLHKIFKLCGSPTESYWRKHDLPSSAGFRTTVPYRRKLSEVYKEFPESVLLLLETLLSVDPDHRSTASSALESEYFKTKPFACDPSCLPKYPPSKEIDAKLRDEEKRQQRPEKQERQDSESRRRSHERKVVQPNKLNHSLSMSMEKPYLDLKSRNESFKSFKEEEKTSHGTVPYYANRNNQSSGERVSYSGPLMSNRNMAKSTMYVKEIAPPPRYPPSRVNPRVLSGSVSSKALLDEPVMNQRRRDRRAYNRADTMVYSRHMTTPIDQSWYDPSDSKIYMSGPLLEQPSRVDQMLEEHDRQLQEFNRQAQSGK